ncbi:phospholipid carrier-dependent glycosyltransferase [Leucobacter weissii]|uniref:Polyprenol-phosphate-mannose--protein mannosyltransferase n=1 Tax=Leucobacter weissii TaxID=1983706 RepID=A0A939SCB7_9MICO|nr:phospholipid carrier-dependent glycosyltransferase [Leucobacter weissii]
MLGLAALLRLWDLARPGELVFDELYYVRDAISQLAHGVPTVWPDDDPAFGDPGAFGDAPSTIAHPPLGKWLIGLGILLLGPDGGWGWRIAAALAGVATVAVTMRLGWLMTRSLWVSAVAGLVLAVDGVHVALSRVGLLDGFLTLFVALGALLLWRGALGGVPGTARRAPHRWPWLLAAGLAFGAATAIKWSGLYPFAAFLTLLAARDLLLSLRGSRSWRSLLGALRRALGLAAITLPTAMIAYLASWWGWIATRQEGDSPWWTGLWEWHVRTLQWHSTLTAEHPYQAHPLTWPLGLRPTGMHFERLDSGAVSSIASLPNPVVTWGGVLALGILLWIAVRALWRAVRGGALAPLLHPTVWVSAFVLTGYLSGWVPWLLSFGRSAVFQFYAVALTPFAALAFALVLTSLAALPAPGLGPSGLLAGTGMGLDPSPASVRGRRISAAMILSAALAMGLLFFPFWSGAPVPEWFWRAHFWLPGWR